MDPRLLGFAVPFVLVLTAVALAAWHFGRRRGYTEGCRHMRALVVEEVDKPRIAVEVSDRFTPAVERALWFDRGGKVLAVQCAWPEGSFTGPCRHDPDRDRTPLLLLAGEVVRGSGVATIDARLNDPAWREAAAEEAEAM